MEVLVRDLESTNGWGLNALMYGVRVFQEPCDKYGEHRCRVHMDGAMVEFYQPTYFGRRYNIHVECDEEMKIIEILRHIGVLEYQRPTRRSASTSHDMSG